MILNQKIDEKERIYTLYPELPKDKPIAMLMRHSERGEIEPGTSGNEIPLTANGRVTAEKLAASIGNNIISVETSPIRRCLETAHFFANDSLSKSIKESPLLGDPGVFIHDPELAWEAFLKHDVIEISKKLFFLEKMDGFHPADQACLTLLSYCLDTLQQKPGFYPFISHDYIVAVFAGRFMGVAPNQKCWPHFLESVFFWENGDKIFFFYKKELKSINHPMVRESSRQ